MSFLANLNQSKNADLPTTWQILETEAQLEAILAASTDKPQVLFKHSTTCGISAGAKHTLELNWDFTETELDFHYLDLLRFRPISNRIAEVLGVTHQSPQVIVVKDGKAVYHSSHHRISVAGIRSALA